MARARGAGSTSKSGKGEASWSKYCEHATLDKCDIARVIARFLRASIAFSIALHPAIPPTGRRAARRATFFVLGHVRPPLHPMHRRLMIPRRRSSPSQGRSESRLARRGHWPECCAGCCSRHHFRTCSPRRITFAVLRHCLGSFFVIFPPRRICFAQRKSGLCLWPSPADFHICFVSTCCAD
jgi:hypothetical protein